MSDKFNSFESDILYFQKGPVPYKSWLHLNISREHANLKYISNICSLFLFTILKNRQRWLTWYIIQFTRITCVKAIYLYSDQSWQLTQWKSNKNKTKRMSHYFRKLSTCTTTMYGGIVACAYQKFCFLCACSLLFFHCRSFSPCWPLGSVIFSRTGDQAAAGEHTVTWLQQFSDA